jgi:cytochrome c biogenesis protein CcmG, thiol:disulfide interchange protein DsbE
MAKKYHRRKKRKQNPFLPVAAGLLFIGIAIVILASGYTKGSPGTDTQGQEAGSPLAVNFPAPDLYLENVNGGTESLADYRDHVVLVNNWATWCPPCKAEMPVLQAYYEEHADDGFMIIAIEAGDPRDVVSQFAKDYKLQFQVWLDPNSASVRAFGNGSLPNSYLIDRTGMVRHAWTGQIDRAALEKYVTPLLMEQ